MVKLYEDSGLETSTEITNANLPVKENKKKQLLNDIMVQNVVKKESYECSRIYIDRQRNVLHVLGY